MLKLASIVLSVLCCCLANQRANIWHLTPESRIMGGNIAIGTDAPYQVKIRTNGHLCGGAIIDEQWILTAAHCVKGHQAKDFWVVLGSLLYSDNAHKRYVSIVIPHEGFNGRDVLDDIALLKTSLPINYTGLIQPIPLNREPLEDGADVTLTGWGSERSGGRPKQKLQILQAKIVNSTACWKKFKPKSTGTDLPDQWQKCVCAIKGRNHGACSGDSGGALVHDGRVVGIVSYGHMLCGTGYPDVYTNVSAYINWIETNMKK